MTSQVSDFVARFFVSDQATHRLSQMEQAAQRFANRTADIGQQLTRTGRQLAGGEFAGMGIDLSGLDPATQAAVSQNLQKLGTDMAALGNSGNISAGQLQGLNTRLENMSRLLQRLGVPSGGIRGVQTQLFGLTASAREAAVANAEAGKQTQFLADATHTARAGVHGLAASSQGLLAGMALLDGNLQHLALSLIFLQFSGALKASLAFGALTVAVGGAIKMITKYLSLKEEIRAMTANFALITKNADAFDLAMERAADITAALGLQGGDAEDHTKALQKAMLLLRETGLDPGNLDHLEIFNAILFRLLQTVDESTGKLYTWESATAKALEIFHDIAREFRRTGTYQEFFDYFGDEFMTLEQLLDDGAIAFENWALANAESIDGLTGLTFAAFKKFQRDINNGVEGAEERMQQFLDEWGLSIPDRFMFEQAFDKAFTDIGDQSKTASEHMVEDFEVISLGADGAVIAIDGVEHALQRVTVNGRDYLIGSSGLLFAVNEVDGGVTLLGTDMDHLSTIAFTGEFFNEMLVASLLPKESQDEIIGKTNDLNAAAYSSEFWIQMNQQMEPTLSKLREILSKQKEISNWSPPSFSVSLPSPYDSDAPPLGDPRAGESEDPALSNPAWRSSGTSEGFTINVDVHDNTVNDDQELADRTAQETIDSMKMLGISVPGFVP